jgi:hypothetical protein
MSLYIVVQNRHAPQGTILPKKMMLLGDARRRRRIGQGAGRRRRSASCPKFLSRNYSRVADWNSVKNLSPQLAFPVGGFSDILKQETILCLYTVGVSFHSNHQEGSIFANRQQCVDRATRCSRKASVAGIRARRAVFDQAAAHALYQTAAFA